jgi:hypothetical protein
VVTDESCGRSRKAIESLVAIPRSIRMCVQKSQKLLLYHSAKMGLFQPVFRGGHISAVASITRVYDGLEIGEADAPRSYFPRVRLCGIFRPE